MTTTTTLYAVTRYTDGEMVGQVCLTAAQFARYEAMSQQPEGLVRLGDMDHDLYELDAEWQDLSPDTTIYLEMLG